MWPAWVPDTARTPGFEQLEKDLYRGALVNFTATEWARKSLIEDYGVDPRRVMAVGMGCNLDAEDEDAPVRKEKIVVFAGYEVQRKGVDVLLEAFVRVRQRVPDVSLYLLGISLPNPPPGVTAFGRVRDRRELASIYRRALVFVMPSRFDPVPTAVIEAMGKRLAVIVSDHCGAAEFLQHGVSGYVARTGDVDSLVNCIEALVSNPDHAVKVGARGHAVLQSAFAWDVVARRMLAAIEQALSRRRAESST
jgi:glycosyltransferase involved in cell wall biosynthesis